MGELAQGVVDGQDGSAGIAEDGGDAFAGERGPEDFGSGEGGVLIFSSIGPPVLAFACELDRQRSLLHRPIRATRCAVDMSVETRSITTSLHEQLTHVVEAVSAIGSSQIISRRDRCSSNVGAERTSDSSRLQLILPAIGAMAKLALTDD